MTNIYNIFPIRRFNNNNIIKKNKSTNLSSKLSNTQTLITLHNPTALKSSEVTNSTILHSSNNRHRVTSRDAVTPGEETPVLIRWQSSPYSLRVGPRRCSEGKGCTSEGVKSKGRSVVGKEIDRMSLWSFMLEFF